MTDESSKPSDTEAPALEVPGTQEVRDLSPEEIMMLNVLASRKNFGDFKQRLAIPNVRTSKKESKFWYKGELLSRAEHDKLTHAEILEANNLVKRLK